jgi:hypothetical protein
MRSRNCGARASSAASCLTRIKDSLKLRIIRKGTDRDGNEVDTLAVLGIPTPS